MINGGKKNRLTFSVAAIATILAFGTLFGPRDVQAKEMKGTTVQDAPSGDEETDTFVEEYYKKIQEDLSESLEDRVPVQHTEEVTEESESTEEVNDESKSTEEDNAVEETDSKETTDVEETAPATKETIAAEETAAARDIAATKEDSNSEGKKYYKYYFVDGLEFFEVTDKKDYSIPEGKVTIWKYENGQCISEEVDFSTAENVHIEYLLYLEDVDASIVDENYTGIAPLDYYGPGREVKNYGDASNDDEVRERATMVWNAFHKANEEVGGLMMFDVDTGKEYTVEKIMDIIKYMNGAYVAKDGAEAKKINDDWINFMVMFLNDGNLIEHVTYHSYSDVVTEDDVKKHTNTLEMIDLGHLLMGDSGNGPFIEWLGDQIKAMYTTTDRDEAVKIYNEISLALTAVVEGNGYVINGVNYTIKDFSDVNDLVFITEVAIGQVLRNPWMLDGYVLNKDNVGIDIIFFTNILNQFNPMCSDELAEELINNGVEEYEGVVVDSNGEYLDIRNYASVMQMKAFNMALSNGEYGIKYYQDNYLDYYDAYIKALNGGTYEDVLESEYVYKKKN